MLRVRIVIPRNFLSPNTIYLGEGNFSDTTDVERSGSEIYTKKSMAKEQNVVNVMLNYKYEGTLLDSP